MEIKRGILLTLLICASIIATAQKSKTKTPKRLYRPDWSIKFNPLAVMAYTPGIEFGLERSLNEQSTLHFGASYLNDFSIYEGQNFQGYKLITEYRHFNLLGSKTNNRYTSFQLQFKQAYSKGTTYVDRANGNYQQIFPLKARNTAFDFLIANGFVVPMGDKLSADLSLVYGTKVLFLALNGIPDDATVFLRDELFFDFTIRNEGREWYPVLRLQAKLNFEL